METPLPRASEELGLSPAVPVVRSRACMPSIRASSPVRVLSSRLHGGLHTGPCSRYTVSPRSAQGSDLLPVSQHQTAYKDSESLSRAGPDKVKPTRRAVALGSGILDHLYRGQGRKQQPREGPFKELFLQIVTGLLG